MTLPTSSLRVLLLCLFGSPILGFTAHWGLDHALMHMRSALHRDAPTRPRMRVVHAGCTQSAPVGVAQPAQSVTPQPARDPNRVSFSMRDADLVHVVETISQLTGRRFIVGSSVRDVRLTVISPTNVTPAEAYNAFLSALATEGLTVVPRSGYNSIEPTARAASLPLPVFTDGEFTPTNDQFVTRVHHVRAITAEQAVRFLSPFRSPDGVLVPNEENNTLVLTDTASNVHRMLRLLSSVDVGAPLSLARANASASSSAMNAKGPRVAQRAR